MTPARRHPDPPRLLIEEWLPAAALGVECMRERSTGQQPPDKRLHVWWARRPLAVSRAAALGSLLPADFDRDAFCSLMGFYASPERIVANERALAVARQAGKRVPNPHGRRAFRNPVRPTVCREARAAMERLWGDVPTLVDPMAGGGSIPLEAARLGLRVIAGEYSPVACSILEATLDYPLRFGADLADKAAKWSRMWRERFNARMSRFYAAGGKIPAYTYIFARTVPCPNTGHPTPLVPDWHLLKPSNHGGCTRACWYAVPQKPDPRTGQWQVEICQWGRGRGKVQQVTPPTYSRGKGVSLFRKDAPIDAHYIKAKAQQGEMGSVLYAVAVKKRAGRLEFRPPQPADMEALAAAEKELARLRPQWEREDVIPTERRYKGDCDRSYVYGHTTWASLFAPRQLLALGVLVEELRRLRPEIIKAEGEKKGAAIEHLLCLGLGRFLNYNSIQTRWHTSQATLAGKMDRHDFAFKATFAEMAACVAGAGLEWALDSVIDAYRALANLPRYQVDGARVLAQPRHAAEALPPRVQIVYGSAANLADCANGSLEAVVVDPPYSDNVQYAELADFFYVWLRRTQGHRHPDWFATELCPKDDEAVVNIARHRDGGKPATLTAGRPAAQARKKANEHYQRLMTETFRECHRVLRDDGVLTVMFTHKQQSAWASLFESLIAAGFRITATWPVQTESQHSLNQAKKNAAQSTVILVSRKRASGAGKSYFDDEMRAKIHRAAQKRAADLEKQALNRVDQLVGSFGPAMEVFSAFDEVRQQTGERVDVQEALQAAADAVAEWRIKELAKRGLEGVDPESRFVLLCWDVMGAAEFRFNEAHLLGKSVNMEVSWLKEAGLLLSSSDKVELLPARERRRDRAIREQAQQLDLEAGRSRTKRTRKIHPGDAQFFSAIDACHALALRYAEQRGGDAGIGACRSMARQQGWNADSPCGKLMEALMNAAPMAVRFPGKKGKKTAADEFPEFRAWHFMLQPLFGLEPPEWKEPLIEQPALGIDEDEELEEEEESEEGE